MSGCVVVAAAGAAQWCARCCSADTPAADTVAGHTVAVAGSVKVGLRVHRRDTGRWHTGVLVGQLPVQRWSARGAHGSVNAGGGGPASSGGGRAPVCAVLVTADAITGRVCVLLRVYLCLPRYVGITSV